MGVVLYIMLSGKVPFPGRSEPEIIQNVMKAEYHFNHAAFNNVSEECKDLIRKCLVKDNKKRISAQEAMQHPWFAGRGQDCLTQGTIGEQSQPAEVIEGISQIVQDGLNAKEAVLRVLR